MGKLLDAELGETADRILREWYAEQQRIRDAIALGCAPVHVGADNADEAEAAAAE